MLCHQPIDLCVAVILPLTTFFKLPVITKFEDSAGSSAVACARNQACVPRPDKKIIVPCFGAMVPDGE